MEKIKLLTKILLIVVILISASIGNVNAAINITSAELYSKGSCGSLIKYNGTEVYTTYVVYSNGGAEYPAYCLNKDLPGVGEKGSYSVNINSLLNDTMLWRVVSNGYPYKTISELGCSNKEEAYTATKQAVYCQIYGREATSYEAIGVAGTRVINAMKQILNNARSSYFGKPSSNIEITSTEGKWVIDSKDNNYLSQNFSVTTGILATNNIYLEGNFPEGTKIVDANNKEIKSVASGKNFKVIIPIKNITSNGEFNIKITSKLATKPVLYGKAPNATWQDYALTASIYEDSQEIKTLSYKQNTSKITIKKQEEGTLKPLQGVEFLILNSAKQPVFTDLITDKNGIVTIENMVPGTYYIEEVKTKAGYVKYNKQIECKLGLNENLTVTVNNSKSTNVEYTNSNQNIVVSQTDKQTNINNSNININEVNNNSKTNVENSNKVQTNANTENIINMNNSNINENLENVSRQVEINNQNKNLNEKNETNNVNVSNNNSNINNLNKTSNINNVSLNNNETNTNKNTNINNENTNKNISNLNNNTSINNSNINTNISNLNSETSINNENSNISMLNGVVKLPKTGM